MDQAFGLKWPLNSKGPFRSTQIKGKSNTPLSLMVLKIGVHNVGILHLARRRITLLDQFAIIGKNERDGEFICAH